MVKFHDMQSPGLVRMKAIYMGDMIARIAAEFSKEKNVTQREIMEAP